MTESYKFINNGDPEKIHPEEDKNIWASFRSGDEEAFIFIYKSYANLLFGYGCRFSTNPEMVKDCLQDFFVYIRGKRSRLGDTTSIKYYLLKSFKRRLLSYVKKNTKEKQKIQDFAFTLTTKEKFYESIYIHQKEDDEEKKHAFLNLSRALKILNPKEKEAIYYFYYQCLSYNEIADLMDFRYVSSARRLIYRSLDKMKNYITSSKGKE